MLVSKSKNFLFIHIPKTAGTSINEILSNHAIPKNKNLIRKISSYFPVRENINKAYFRAHPKAVSVSKKIGQKPRSVSPERIKKSLDMKNLRRAVIQY